MPLISYKNLEKYLNDKGEKPFASVYLLFGEEFLYKTKLTELLNAMLPDFAKSLNYEPVDGSNDNIPDIISNLNTFSFLPDLKIVEIRDSRIFYSKQNKETILEKAKQAFDENDIKKAARQILTLLGLLELQPDDFKGEKKKEILAEAQSLHGDDSWIDDVMEYCLDNNLSASSGNDYSKFLQEAIKKGFPEKNHLIITTDYVDKRRGLYKIIKKTGMIIDCSVPLGGRMEEKRAQNTVLQDILAAVLSKSGKKIAKNAYSALYEMVGFDLRTFTNSLEKLVNYIGNRDMIMAEDVEAILKRTKKDPLYEFTNAITDQNRDMALFYLKSLLDGGEINHPLQLIAAITNQIRKLLIIKGFMESPFGKVWQSNCQYNNFQNSIIPAIIEYDKDFLSSQKEWDNMLLNGMLLKGKSGTEKKSGSELMVAKTPKNPFPVYKMFQKADKFKKDKILEAFVHTAEADLSLKSTGMDSRLILEKLVLQICDQKTIERIL